MDLFVSIFSGVLRSFVDHLFWMAGFAVAFTGLALLDHQACNPGKLWWKSRDLVTDITYGFAFELINPILNIVLVTLVVALLFGLTAGGDVSRFFEDGHGPLSAAPAWAQIAIYMVGTDFLLYWNHRFFHGRHMWAFHAVHHSPEDLQWTATYRTHPVNRLLGPMSVSMFMLLIGIPPWVMVVLVPFDMVTGAWVHSNLNWTLGPLKYVVATPVFHRWHHTGIDEGGERNFAPTFSFWDVIFGTFYMPEGKLPSNYGVDDKAYPKDIFRQMVVPFIRFRKSLRKKKKRTATAPAGADGPSTLA